MNSNRRCRGFPKSRCERDCLLSRLGGRFWVWVGLTFCPVSAIGAGGDVSVLVPVILSGFDIAEL